MRLKDNLFITCDNCNQTVRILLDELENTSATYERPMGDELAHHFYGEVECGGCQNVMELSVDGYEYPLGSINFTEHRCSGGQFIQEPSWLIDYEFDESYLDYAYNEISDVEYYLEQQRNRIRQMTPSEFEYFVADIFKELGFDVKVTKATRDGGADIIATKTEPTLLTYLIECKHWRNKVDVSVVRSVYGVQMAKRANQSVVVTSSTFTRDARKFAEEQQTLMALWDIEDLIRHL